MNELHSAPAVHSIGYGKVILLGEHAVVYGRPALAAALSHGCRAYARPASGASDQLWVEPWGVRVKTCEALTDPDQELLRIAFRTICERYPLPRKALQVQAVMDIPGSAGLGGSAALSVAVVHAFGDALGIKHSPQEIIDASLAWEGVFHGNPSGVDSTMAARGGIAVFRKGQPVTPLRLFKPLILVIGHSGEPGSTKAMVEGVARRHARDPQKTDQIFDAIGSIVESGKRALEQADHPRLGQLMDFNQALLNSLLLSTTKLEEMCDLARKAGALGAKLTGGGGGGCMIALAKDRDSAETILKALQDRGFDAFVAQVAQ